MGKFKKTETTIDGVYIIEPTVFGDNRGYFMETYSKKDFEEIGLNYDFVQDNQSKSKKGVLRGLHFQKENTQAKLVRCIKGEVFDVAVDLRPGSKTYGKWEGVILTEENKKMFMIPRGFAHGFLVLSDEAEFTYKCDDIYNHEAEGGLKFDDPDVGIEWPMGDLKKEDLMNFRQLGSLTPGHPEYRHTVGVEATTGPLGAGMGMAVGMAMAEAHLAAVFNKENYPVVDHYTYVLGGDGCMMEGISSEAFSLAGTLGLGKLIVLYDSNRISIEGSTDIAFTENVQKRMEAFGFQLITVEDGNDLDAIGAAIEEAKADTTRPSFITVKTQIGYGCPAKQGSASAHGEPLGEENVAAMKEFLQWPSKEPFYVPDEVYENFAKIAEEKADVEAAWNVMFAAYCQEYPEMEALWYWFHNASISGYSSQ